RYSFDGQDPAAARTFHGLLSGDRLNWLVGEQRLVPWGDGVSSYGTMSSGHAAVDVDRRPKGDVGAGTIGRRREEAVLAGSISDPEVRPARGGRHRGPCR